MVSAAEVERLTQGDGPDKNEPIASMQVSAAALTRQWREC
jgi:hypothetical protein